MAELIVRKAERGDAEAVAKLEQICFAAPWSEEALIRDMTENEMAAYVVAEYEGQIVGYVGLWIIIDDTQFFHLNPKLFCQFQSLPVAAAEPYGAEFLAAIADQKIIRLF